MHDYTHVLHQFGEPRKEFREPSTTTECNGEVLILCRARLSVSRALLSACRALSSAHRPWGELGV